MINSINEIKNWAVIEEQIIFWRTHLDIFIEDCFPPIKLTRDQHVLAREFGNCSDCKFIQNRGAGKTWLIALCCFAVACLYPGSTIAVCSGTAAQATLILQKLKMLTDTNPHMANELTSNGARTLIQLAKDKGKCWFKNGSSIESFSLTTMRGQRCKVIVIDEAPEVKQEDQEAIVAPTKNFTRANCMYYGFKDFESKTCNITSACEKSNEFFDACMKTVRSVAKGDKSSFFCALDYKAAVANGITDMSFFMKEKERMPELIFQMEYESRFVGATSNSAFPFDLVQSCRTLQTVETSQPKNSKSRYVISLDIATSQDKNADNSIISVIKFTERSDGSYGKKLVYMRSFHGKTLDVLADEIRKLYHLEFPNVEKIIYDARGLGDSLDRFFDKEWIDMTTGKEYPPLTVDDIPSSNGAAIQVLHPFRAVQTLNQRIYTNMRVCLEKRTLEIPINSRIMLSNESEKEDKTKQLTMQEKAIFVEADALQIEMGNIVAKQGASGNILYDTPRPTMHKDRYSSIAMGLDYVCELEKESIKRHTRGAAFIGLADAF